MRDSLPEDLRPYEADLYRIVRGGLDLFDQRYGTLKGVQSLTAQRRNVHDCMVETAHKILGEKHCKRRGNLFYLEIGHYRIKLKKFNERLMTSSYRTQAVFEFLSQALHTLFDFDVENLQLGYIPEGLTSANYAIVIAKPTMSGRPEWHYELKPAAAAVAPIFPVTDPNVAPKTRVSPKPTKFRKVNKDKGE